MSLPDILTPRFFNRCQKALNPYCGISVLVPFSLQAFPSSLQLPLPSSPCPAPDRPALYACSQGNPFFPQLSSPAFFTPGKALGLPFQILSSVNPPTGQLTIFRQSTVRIDPKLSFWVCKTFLSKFPPISIPPFKSPPRLRSQRAQSRMQS